MATLAAHDQENAVRNITIGPAGKPLNAGSKAFGAKTPGKTPFKVPLNDENTIKQAGKSALKTNGKGNEDLFLTSKKGGKQDGNAFMTPAGPRTRAPLGMKTTNAKSNAFQTPAPLTQKTQKVSPRLHRPKVKIHQPEVEAESEDDAPEIEHMPPKEVPLSNDVDDYPREWKIPVIKDEDIMRGIWNAYHNPIEDDGRPKKLREFEEGLAKEKKQATEEFEKMFAAQMVKEEAEVRRYMGMDEPKTAASKPRPATTSKRAMTGVSTLKARSAAAALTSTSKPSYAAPTANVKSRVPTGIVSSKKTIKPFAETTSSRQAAAVAASKSTIGYAQGRAGRAAPTARKPLSNVTKAPYSATTRRPASVSAVSRAASSTVRSRSAFSRSSSIATDGTLVDGSEEEQSYETAEDVQRELDLMILSRSDDEGEEAWANNFNSRLHDDPLAEELEDFQFKLPEGF